MNIVRTEGVCGGRARINGTRITVSDVLSQLAGGMNIDEISEDFEIDYEDVIGAVVWAKNYINGRVD